MRGRKYLVRHLGTLIDTAGLLLKVRNGQGGSNKRLHGRGNSPKLTASRSWLGDQEPAGGSLGSLVLRRGRRKREELISTAIDKESAGSASERTRFSKDSPQGRRLKQEVR